MTTMVDLYIGGNVETYEPQVHTVELVLANGYTAPSPLVLVLRSAPDIAAVTGTFIATERQDSSEINAVFARRPDGRTGTLVSTERQDQSAANGMVGMPAVSGTMETTEVSRDSGVFAGTHNIVPVTGTLPATDIGDGAAFDGTYTQKWVGAMDTVEAPDDAQWHGETLPYVGPGFWNSTERADTATMSGQSIPDISMTMETQESRDAGNFVAQTWEYFEAPLLTEYAFASDVLLGEISSTSLVERAFASDVLEASEEVAVTELALATDILDGQLQTTAALTDEAIATDVLAVILYASAVEIGIATDTLSSVVTGELEEIAVGSDLLSSTVALTGALTETGIATDTLGWLWIGEATETGLATDTLDGRVAQWESATETGLAADVLEGGVTVYAALTETGHATDTLAGTLSLIGVLADTALAGDALTELAQTVMVINAETGAASTYVFTPALVSAVDFQGVLYLAGPDGLYALDAAQDDSGSIVWSLRTGFSNLGSDRLKRVQDANFQARTEADTTFQVVSDRYGTKQEWNYRLPPLTRDSYRDGVVKVGKGIQSVYWQFAAQGVGPAEIDQLRLVVEPLSRRR